MNILQTVLNAETIKGCWNNQNNNDYTTRMTKYKFTRIKEWLRNSNCEKYDAAMTNTSTQKNYRVNNQGLANVFAWKVMQSLLPSSILPSSVSANCACANRR
jgi:hypothetical protein